MRLIPGFFRTAFYFCRSHNLSLSDLPHTSHNLYAIIPRNTYLLLRSSRLARVRLLSKHKILGSLRRIAILLLVVWTVVSLVTILIELVPGDPAVAVLGEQATPEQFEQFRQRHGLDRPPFFFSFPRDSEGNRHFQWHGADNRYTDYWKGILQGDMGLSFRTGQTGRGPHSRTLSCHHRTRCCRAVDCRLHRDSAWGGGRKKQRHMDRQCGFGDRINWYQSAELRHWPDAGLRVCRKARLAGAFGPFRLGRYYSAGVYLGAALSAILTRMVRSSVIEELGEDYVRTARAKGLSETQVVYKHVLKNGLIPVVTILGLQLGILLAGAIITEKIFGWPGLGLLLVEDGIGKRDYRVVQGCVLVISLTYIVANSLNGYDLPLVGSKD